VRPFGPAGTSMPMPDDTPDRDPAHPTREELLETARSEGLMATEEETDPDFTEPPPDDEPDQDLPTP
jgi:hypothetical protein